MNKNLLLVSSAVILVGVVPLLMYTFVLGILPSIQAADALAILNQTPEEYYLIDVRSSTEYGQNHIEGAVLWPLEDILKVDSLDEIPSQYQGKQLIFICNAGFLSGEAVRHMQKIGFQSSLNAQGGMQEWIKSAAENPQLRYTHFVQNGVIKTGPFQELSLFEQIIPILSGFVIKPSHMILSLVMILVLWKSRVDGDLKILNWGLGFLLLGELFCAINFLFFADDSLLSEYFHNYGMLLGFGFIFFAMFEGLDERIFRFSALKKPCMFIPLCEKCFKNAEVSCKVKNIFLWACIFLAILSMIPFLVPIHADSYMTEIFGTLHQYAKVSVFQYYEFRVIPIVSVLSFLAAYTLQKLSPNKILPIASRVFFSGGLGGLFFSIFRLLLGSAFQNQLHFSDFWEEATEMMLVVLVAYILWQFRSKLFPDRIVLIPQKWVE
jgi:rhodanese-related sulfurtransferase